MKQVPCLPWSADYDSEPWFKALVIVFMLLNYYTWSVQDFAICMPYSFWILVNSLSGDVIQFLEGNPSFNEVVSNIM